MAKNNHTAKTAGKAPKTAGASVQTADVSMQVGNESPDLQPAPRHGTRRREGGGTDAVGPRSSGHDTRSPAGLRIR